MARCAAVAATCLLASIIPATPSHSQHDRILVPVLIMHHVKLDRPTDNATERGLTIPPSQFAQYTGYLVSHGYHTVSARALVNYLRQGMRLPDKPVVLTFDDGYADMYAHVYPVLRKRRLTATFFIVPGLVGRPRYLTWRQVKVMASHGMDIEAHSMTHPDLTMVPPNVVWHEISQSRRVLQSRLQRPVRLFAYPYGDYNALVLRDVHKAGYWAAFTTHQGWWQLRSQLLTLPRVYVNRDDTLSIFAGLLAGG